MRKSFIYSSFICLFTILLAGACAHSQNDTIHDTSKTAEIDHLIKTYVDYEQFNGAILVAHKGQMVYKKAFGLAQMDWNIPNQTTTKFRLGSVTKQFTSMLIMQLVSEKKLDLHAPIATYLPSYPKPQADQITIHHLLTHSSGIPNYTSFSNYRTAMRNPTSPSELVRMFADSTLQFTPGDRFDYSNSGYALLGEIIEKVTGQPYGKVLDKKIFTPLNMNGSGYEKGPKIVTNRALGYYRNGSRFVNANYIDMSMSYAAGGIHSTVEDLYRWDKALYTEKLLPKKYLDSLFLPYQPIGNSHYAYGWNVGKMPIGNTEEKIRVIDHDGIINGFSSLLVRIPSSESTVILLHNTGRPPMYHMTRGILGILFDKTYSMPVQSVAIVLAKKIREEGLFPALAFYESIKDSPNYYKNENALNLLGYDFLENDKTEIAHAIFTLNLEAFPNSFNVYDSYAEALMKLGKKKEAITNYRKSLELNPNNDNAKRMLEQLGESSPLSKSRLRLEPR